MSGQDSQMWTPSDQRTCRCGKYEGAEVHGPGALHGHAFEPPVTAADVAEDNPRVIANRLTGLQRDMNAGFESMREALKTFARIEAKLDVVIDRQNETDRAIADLRRGQERTEARLAALEAKPALPTAARVMKPRRKR